MYRMLNRLASPNWAGLQLHSTARLPVVLVNAFLHEFRREPVTHVGRLNLVRKLQ